MTEKRHAGKGLPLLKLHDPEHPRTRKSVTRAALKGAAILLLLLLLGLGRTLTARWLDGRTLEAQAAENALVHVRVIEPGAAKSAARLTLPGTLLGSQEAQIYARTSGYVRTWLKDIGAPVKKGEVLAILDIPEVNRQVDEAAANYALARTAFERWTRLRAEDAVSQQELDEKTGAYHQTEAILQRLQQQLAFGQVLAPFDGIVTRRNVNNGDLVNAGNGGSAQALFAMAQTDRLHVYAYVPQERAAKIRVGDSVDIIQPGHPDQPLKARIARSAGAIDATTRTLQIDIEVANPEHLLLPGAYVDLVLSPLPGDKLVLPTNTLLFGAEGPQVAVVKDGVVERRAVSLGTDYGRVVEVSSGIGAGDQIIINPPDAIVAGQRVVVEAAAAEAKPAEKPAR